MKPQAVRARVNRVKARGSLGMGCPLGGIRGYGMRGLNDGGKIKLRQPEKGDKALGRAVQTVPRAFAFSGCLLLPLSAFNKAIRCFVFLHIGNHFIYHLVIRNPAC